MYIILFSGFIASQLHYLSPESLGVFWNRERIRIVRQLASVCLDSPILINIQYANCFIYECSLFDLLHFKQWKTDTLLDKVLQYWLRDLIQLVNVIVSCRQCCSSRDYCCNYFQSYHFANIGDIIRVCLKGKNWQKTLNQT